jgi:cation transport regulator ChaB
MSGDLDYNSHKFVKAYLIKHESNKQIIMEKFRNTPKLADAELEELMKNKLSLDLEDFYKELLKNALKLYEDHQKFLEEVRNLKLTADEKEKQILIEKRESAEKLAKLAEEIAVKDRRIRKETEQRLREESKYNSTSYRLGYVICSFFTLGFYNCD